MWLNLSSPPRRGDMLPDHELKKTMPKEKYHSYFGVCTLVT